VRLRLTPTETSFYALFTESSANLIEATRLLGELTNAPADGRAGVASQIRDCEHAGDDVTHRIYRQLNSTFITPFDREDIYRLASRLDDVMDFVEAAADLIVLYGVEELPVGVSAQIDVLQRAAGTTADAMPRLRGLKDLEEYWIEINRLENEADQIYRKLVAELFSGSYDALTVLKLKELVDELERAADAFEHVADTVETIVVKES
jgi:predicted phosphate transport protein (TIGR00153 family)